MAFNKRTWIDRDSEYPDRRRITSVDNEEDTKVVSVEREEGVIFVPGDKLDSTALNDLENRISEMDSVATSAITSAQTTANSRIPLSGSTAITGTLRPSTNAAVDLGSTSVRWRSIYASNMVATTFTGNLSGNATTATSATRATTATSATSASSSTSTAFTIGTSRLTSASAQTLVIYPQTGQDYAIRMGVHENWWRLMPLYTNTFDLGSPNALFRNAYIQNGVTTSSDANKKTDIADIDSDFAEEFIMSLKPKTYKMIDGTSGRTHHGLIAQDVAKSLSELGVNTSDFAGYVESPEYEYIAETILDESTGEKIHQTKEVATGGMTLGLRYEEFIPAIISVVQTQQKEIEELKKMISSKE